MTTKVCSKCSISKPIEEFYLSPTKWNPNYRRSRCIPCVRDSNKQWWGGRGRDWRIENKDRVTEYRDSYNREYYAKNREVILVQKQEYQKRSADKIKQYRTVNAARISIQQAEYLQRNKELFNEKKARRRAAKIQATPQWYNPTLTRAVYLEAKERSKKDGIQHHVDHIVPLQHELVCGLHVHYNLQVLPGKTNLSKGNRHWPDMP